MPQTLRVQMTAAITAIALVAFFVVRTSQAAFTGTTASAGNTFTGGTVALSDDDGGVATFTATNMGPGDSVTQCVTVAYTGSLVPNNPVTMSATATAGETGMAPSMAVSVNESADCTAADGTSGDVTGDLSSLGAGTTAWTPSGSGDSRGFWITVTMDGGIDDIYQGKSVTADFTWSVVDDG